MSQSLPRRFYRKTPPQIKQPEVIALKPKKIQFPSISLIIPEGAPANILNNPIFLTAFLCCFLMVAIGIVGYQMRYNLEKMQILNQQKDGIEKQIAYWQDVVRKHEGYRDAFYQLAVLEYRIRDNNAAFFYLEKTLEIDPNFIQAQQLMDKIIKK